MSSGAGVHTLESLPGCSRDALQSACDIVQARLVRIEHGAAAIGGETVAVEIHQIDVRGSLRDAVLEDAGAFVDQRIDAALDDLLRTYTCAA